MNPDEIISVVDTQAPPTDAIERQVGSDRIRRRVTYADGRWEEFEYDRNSPPPADHAQQPWGRPVGSGVDNQAATRWRQSQRPPTPVVRNVDGVPNIITTDPEGNPLATPVVEDANSTRQRGAQADTAQATAENAQELLRQRQQNQAAGLGYYTDAELDKIARDERLTPAQRQELQLGWARVSADREQEFGRNQRAQIEAQLRNKEIDVNEAIRRDQLQVSREKNALDRVQLLETTRQFNEQMGFSREKLTSELDNSERNRLVDLRGQDINYDTNVFRGMTEQRNTDARNTVDMRSQDISQRGQNLEAGTRLAVEASQAARDMFKNTAPEGTAGFLNDVLRAHQGFYPAGVTVPQLPTGANVNVPLRRDIANTATSTFQGAMAPGFLPPDVAPVTLPGQVVAPPSRPYPTASSGPISAPPPPAPPLPPLGASDGPVTIPTGPDLSGVTFSEGDGLEHVGRQIARFLGLDAEQTGIFMQQFTRPGTPEGVEDLVNRYLGPVAAG